VWETKIIILSDSSKFYLNLLTIKGDGFCEY